MPKQCRREEVVSTQLALLTVVSPWVRGQESWLVLIFGVVGTLSIFLWAYRLEGGLEEDKK